MIDFLKETQVVWQGFTVFAIILNLLLPLSLTQMKLPKEVIKIVWKSSLIATVVVGLLLLFSILNGSLVNQTPRSTVDYSVTDQRSNLIKNREVK